MPIKIVAKKKPKKDPFRADKTQSLNKDFSKRTAKANQEAMKNVKKKAGGGKMKSKNMDSLLARLQKIGPDDRYTSQKQKDEIDFIMGQIAKMTPVKKKAEGGSLKPVPEGNKGKGLSKLPTPVRNKMGFMKKGGKVMKMRGGGMADRGISFRMR